MQIVVIPQHTPRIMILNLVVSLYCIYSILIMHSSRFEELVGWKHSSMNCDPLVGSVRTLAGPMRYVCVLSTSSAVSYSNEYLMASGSSYVADPNSQMPSCCSALVC